MAVGAEFCWTVFRSSKRFLASCCQMPLSEEIPRVVLLQVVPTCSCPQINWIVPSLHLSSRIDYGSVDTELIYGMNCLEQEFCVCWISVEVNGGFTFLLLLDSTTQGTDTQSFRIAVPFLSAVQVHCPFWAWFELPYHFSSEPGHKNVQCPAEKEPRCVILGVFRHLKHNSHHSCSTQCHWTFAWRWSGLWTPLAGFSASPSLLGFFKNWQWWKSWEICTLEVSCSSTDTNCILVGRIQPESFHLTFPSFYCIWSVFHLSNTKNGISVDTYFCLCPLEGLIIGWYRSRPRRWWTQQALHIQNFFRMFSHQLFE